MLNRPENSFTYLFAATLFLLVAFLVFWGFWLEPLGIETLYLEGSTAFKSEGAGLLPLLSNDSIIYMPPLPYLLAKGGHCFLPFGSLGFRLLHILLAAVAFRGFYLTVREYMDARTAFYSCCVLLASFPLSVQLVFATPASLASIFVGSALFFFYLALKTRKNSYLWGLYLSLAAVMLCQGFSAFLLPVSIMVIYLMFKIKMDARTLQKIKAGRGLLLVVLICAPWFVYAGIQTEGIWLQQFLQQQAWSYSSGTPGEGSDAFYFPFLFVVLLIIPFGLFLPTSFAMGWKLKVKKDLLMLASLGLLVFLIYYAFSDSFYPHFLLPVLPFAALLIGHYLSNLHGRSLSKGKSPFGFVILLLTSFSIPVFLYLELDPGMEAAATLPHLFFYLALGILPIGTLFSIFLWHRKKTDAGVCLLTLSFFLFNSLLLRLALYDDALWNSLWWFLK